jgi:hypothetical protein
MKKDFVILPRKPTSQELLERLTDIVPSFSDFWQKDDNLFVNEDGKFSVHGVFSQFSAYLRDNFFDRGVLVIENPFMIINSKNEEMEIDKLIGDSVQTAYLSESEIRIIFESDAVLVISMRDEDFVGPEAASWNPNDGPIIVFN